MPRFVTILIYLALTEELSEEALLLLTVVFAERLVILQKSVLLSLRMS